MIGLSREALCGHNDALSMFSDLSGESTICQPCYGLAREARDAFLAGRTSYRATRAVLAPLLGREARGYCRGLWWARLRIRLHVVR